MSVVESAEQTAAGVRYKSPKSGRARTLTLSATVVSELRQHRLMQAEEFLTLGVKADECHLRLYSAGRRADAAAQPLADLDCLCHTSSANSISRPQACSRDAHARRRVHPKVASERLGHSNFGITLDLYSHVLPGMQEDAAARDEAHQIAEKKRAEEWHLLISGVTVP
jgi:integrase